jgi:cbb3-type cytochrome oxidase maturation protein
LLGATGWAVAFVWFVHRGQLEDLDGAAWRPLGNDERHAQELRSGALRGAIFARSPELLRHNLLILLKPPVGPGFAIIKMTAAKFADLGSER